MKRNLNDSDREYWEKLARDYDTKTRFLSRPVPRMLTLVRESTAKSKRILEVAAGTGLLTSVLPAEASITATDYAEAMVAQLQARMTAEGRKNVVCERADIYRLPYEDDSFDTAVAANVLHLVPDLPQALAELRRVLVPGGQLLAPTYCHNETALAWITSRLMALASFPGHRRFSLKSLKAALTNEGLVIDTSESLPGILPIGFVSGRFA